MKDSVYGSIPKIENEKELLYAITQQENIYFPAKT